ncbi:MAG: acetate/propionate family kinase [Peptococcaceae bacterium]|jgi:acetate kinase|nr:acetate/propionate family kinase [Peptococcaceae bacterium]
MNQHILVCNVGSTSLKFKLYAMPSQVPLATGKVERVSDRENAIFHYENVGVGYRVTLEKQSIPTYTDGISQFFHYLTKSTGAAIDSIESLDGIGFKTVLAKGFYGVHLLDDAVLAGMRDYLNIAPVHNSCYLEAIHQCKTLLPSTPLVGVFETEFHMTVPLERKLYGVPYEWYEKYGVQKFGYHGASHRYISETIAARCGGGPYKLISCHLGGSSSLCAVENGQSIDTSFGFSLQTGVMHANRVGDMDAYIIPFLLDQGMSLSEILAGLDQEGGMLGISGVSNDLRFITEQAQENERAALAIAMFCNDVTRYIGSFHVQLGGLEHLVFAGGIGENSVPVREAVCRKLAVLGVELDEEANQHIPADGVISTSGSRVKVYVIPTDEEAVVARKAYQLLQN